MAPSQSKFVASTTAYTGLSCHALLVVSATVFTTLTGMTGESISGVTFPAGVTLYGSFSSVTLASGSVILYLQP